MQTPTIRELGRPRFKGNRISNKRREMLFVQPADRLFIRLNTNRDAVVTSTRLALCFARVAGNSVSTRTNLRTEKTDCSLVPSHVSTPDHQNVTLSQRSPLPLQRLGNLFNWNFMPRHRTRRLAILLLVPPYPVA
jgi:hypothetical protein